MADVVIEGVARKRVGFARRDKSALDPTAAEFTGRVIGAERVRLSRMRRRGKGKIGHAELAFIVERLEIARVDHPDYRTDVDDAVNRIGDDFWSFHAHFFI